MMSGVEAASTGLELETLLVDVSCSLTLPARSEAASSGVVRSEIPLLWFEIVEVVFEGGDWSKAWGDMVMMVPGVCSFVQEEG